MSPEFEKDQIVKIIDDSEYIKTDFKDLEGTIKGTIPSNSKDPIRIMVSLDGRGIVNFRPSDLEVIVKEH